MSHNLCNKVFSEVTQRLSILLAGTMGHCSIVPSHAKELRKQLFSMGLRQFHMRKTCYLEVPADYTRQSDKESDIYETPLTFGGI